MCCAPQRRALFRHLTSQALRAWCVLYILTWKFAAGQNGVHDFDISISNSAPNMVFCAFWLGNVLRATTACTFSTSQLPKVLRAWCVFVCFDFSTFFAHLHLLSSDSFSSLIFFLLLFSSLTLTTSASPSVHIVGSLTSKLPLIISMNYPNHIPILPLF